MRLLPIPLLLAALALAIATPAAAEEPAQARPPAASRHPILSDEPRQEPRPIRSRHFSFLTDVSDREAKLILDKLETMVGLLERSFGRRQRGVIEGFIVHDLAVWPEGVLTEPLGIEKIKEQAGICFTTALGPERRAVLYACDDPGIIQHECTHGFCHLTFGGVGPLWLAEGLAELGRWWREKEKGVNVPPAIIAHLHAADRPPLAAITAPHQPPSNDWRDYTWRYALCQMLLDNPNYADRFRALAVALMEGQPGVSFESVYGPVSREVGFEFEQFLTHVGNGYRADLTAWPWKAKQRKLAPGGVGRAKVKGAAGWQASGVEVEAGAVYVITAEGTCRLATDAEPTSPEGDAAGRGRLTGALYADFTLSPQIPLGSHTSWIAPADGLLMLRAADDWTELADNDGTLSITIRRGEAP
ncbi:MAG: hypothetical protein RLZZ326_3332 [Planctomycetota bacterium]|jgi:hypothetical protein